MHGEMLVCDKVSICVKRVKDDSMTMSVDG